MPAHDLVEVMRVQIRDGESLLQFSGGKSRAQVLAEAPHAIRTVAIVPVKVRLASVCWTRGAVLDLRLVRSICKVNRRLMPELLVFKAHSSR